MAEPMASLHAGSLRPSCNTWKHSQARRVKRKGVPISSLSRLAAGPRPPARLSRTCGPFGSFPLHGSFSSFGALAPYAPHLAEEAWEGLQGEGSLSTAPWPLCDPSLLVEDTVTLAVQVNGKMRGTVELEAGAEEAVAAAAARDLPAVARLLDGAAVKKTVYVPGRILNFIVQGGGKK